MFKSPDPAAGGNVLYVFIIDPAVKGADYSVSNILAEAFPAAEVNEMYKRVRWRLRAGHRTSSTCTLVRDLGK